MRRPDGPVSRSGTPRAGSGGDAGRAGLGDGALATSKWLVLATVGLGTFLSVLDSSVVNVSLPTITRELRTDLTTIQWVVMAYLLTITGLLLTFGRVADLVGRKQVYVAGMAVFTVGTLLCGLALDVVQLIAFRVVQGVGSAMVMAIGPALTASAFPPSERGKALGINSTTVALGGVSGPIIGGLLADLIDWRWVFFFRVPFGALAVLLAVRYLSGGTTPRRQRFDILGAALLFVWLAALTLGVNQGRTLGWTSPSIVAILSVALVGLVAFILTESRVAAPMLELAVFRNRLFSAASASSLLSFSANFTVNLLMPFYLITALGLTQRAAGLMLIPQPLTMSIVAPISGWLSDRIGARILSTVGLGIACLTLLSISRLDSSSSLSDVGIRLAAMGLGIGLFNSPNSSSLLSSVPQTKLGIASGMMASMRNLGMVLGTAVAGAVWTGRMAFHADRLASTGVIDQAAIALRSFVGGFQDAFVVAAAICSIGVLTSLVRGPRRVTDHSPDVEDQGPSPARAVKRNVGDIASG